MGDPVGIGPEIICKALSRQEVYSQCRPLVIGDINVLKAACKITGANLGFKSVDSPETGAYKCGAIDVYEKSHLEPDSLILKKPTAIAGAAMVDYILCAIDFAMENQIHAITTGPIHKGAMHLAGYDFAGHTELLAKRTNTSKYVMMLAGDRLKVVLVTIHIAISQVPAALTKEKIITTIRVTGKALKERFGVKHPRLAVAALNPHAGEDGLFGDEEKRIIAPALEVFKNSDIFVTSPMPPDTLFFQAQSGKWDAVVCMYHDQGLIPFKMIHFEDGVNTTLGLPIIRTSVDHGTAYDIAGTGKANPQSLIAAIKMAALQARMKQG